MILVVQVLYSSKISLLIERLSRSKEEFTIPKSNQLISIKISKCREEKLFFWTNKSSHNILITIWFIKASIYHLPLSWLEIWTRVIQKRHYILPRPFHAIQTKRTILSSDEHNPCKWTLPSDRKGRIIFERTTLRHNFVLFWSSLQTKNKKVFQIL